MNPPVAWLDSVFRDRSGQWVLDALSVQNGRAVKFQIPLSQGIGGDMFTLDPWSQLQADTFFQEVSIPLERGQRLINPCPIVRNIWRGLPVSDKHAIFRFEVGEQAYLIPALFLISRLFLGNKSVGKYLLQPGMLETFVDPAPIQKDGTLNIRLPPHIPSTSCSEGLARTLAWLAVERSAEQAWRSVWFKMSAGRIDLDLPAASLHGRLGGVVIDNMRLVTWSREVTVNTSVPNTLVVTGKRGTQKLFKRGGSL